MTSHSWSPVPMKSPHIPYKFLDMYVFPLSSPPCSSQHIPLFPMLPKLLNYFIRLARVPLCLIIILNIVCAALFKYVLIALLNNPTKQWPKERAIYQPFKTRSWGGDSLERPIFQLPVLVSMAASNVMLSTSLRACWEGTANSLGFRVYLPNATSVFMQGKAPLTV
jgi:hypothetical protein